MFISQTCISFTNAPNPVQISILMQDFAMDEQMEKVLRDDGTLEAAMETWKRHHLDDLFVCYSVPDKYFNFTFECKDLLIRLNVPITVQTCMNRWPMDLALAQFGKKFLEKF
jgi:hypothetical protein